MTNYIQILDTLKIELVAGLDYLDYSYKKVQRLNIKPDSRDPETLETLEALVSRFSRVTDIFVAKYLRSFAEKDDPAFRGTLVDTIYYAEKKGLILSAKNWIEIRELRNKISHEYAAADLSIIFQQVFAQTPQVLELRNKLP